MPVPLSLVLVGDILTGRGVTPALRSPQNTLWRYQSVIAGADLAWGNLEEAPHSALNKRRPFYNPGDLEVLRDAGFDGFSLANNHSLDAGESGAKATWKQLKQLEVKEAGMTWAGEDGVPIWEMKGRRVALLAATQWGPFQSGTVNLRRIERQKLVREVQELTAKNIFVVASLHWGTEGVSALTTEQRSLAHALIDAGALAVWGHHPHVAGSVETYKGRPIFASTGNFLWDKMPTAQSGLLARLEIDGREARSARVNWTTTQMNPEARVPRSPPTPKGETHVQAVPSVGNGQNVWVLWTKTADGHPVLRALEAIEDGWKVRATGHPREVKRIELADVNGDGKDELVVELRQRSKLDAGIKPRLHVYGIGARGFVSLWRGSMLSRPFFEWVTVGRTDGTQRDIAALERGLNEKQWLTVYRWNGFGLRVVWQRSFQEQIFNLKSGCDTTGVFLSFEIRQKNGRRLLRARRTLGEDWEIKQNKTL